MTQDSSQHREPDPKFIAEQLRKPSGAFASKIGKKMNTVNKPLYDLAFDVMQLKDHDQILEIGFGTGAFFEDLFAKNELIKVSGLDFSKEMVETARETNQKIVSDNRLDLRIGNSKSIPFNDQTFDTVFCNMVIFFWNSPEDHLKEIRRVLKPGGLFYSGFRTRESMLLFPFVEHGFNLYSVDEWKEILTQNGFSIQKIDTRLDPPLDPESNDLELESCCIVAKK